MHGRHGGFGPHHFKPPFGMAGHLHGFAGGGRARRGDVRAAVLRLLSEQPMHGYQIIQELSARSGGAWSPSAGSVYPTLQLLADEGLVTAEETAGKKVFSLTEAGIAAVAETADQPAPWEEAAQSDSGAGATARRSGKLMQRGLPDRQDRLGGADRRGDRGPERRSQEALRDPRRGLGSPPQPQAACTRPRRMNEGVATARPLLAHRVLLRPSDRSASSSGRSSCPASAWAAGRPHAAPSATGAPPCASARSPSAWAG